MDKLAMNYNQSPDRFQQASTRDCRKAVRQHSLTSAWEHKLTSYNKSLIRPRSLQIINKVATLYFRPERSDCVGTGETRSSEQA